MKIQELKQLIKEVILQESFASPTVKRFFDELQSIEGNFKGKLPYNLKYIQWDKVPDSAVEYLPANEAKPYMKSGNLIIWMNKTKKTAKHVGYEYTKWGSKVDKSVYKYPGITAVTIGKDFLYGQPGSTGARPAVDRYEKPNSMNVKKLTDEIADYALVFLEDLSQYSAAEQQQTRSRQKFGATALMDSADILAANQSKYKKALFDLKNIKGTAPVVAEVSKFIAEIRSRLEDSANIKFDSLLSFKTDTYYDNQELASVKNIDTSKIEKLVQIYNSVVRAFGYYTKEAKSYGVDNQYTIREKKSLDDAIADAKTRLESL